MSDLREVAIELTPHTILKFNDETRAIEVVTGAMTFAAAVKRAKSWPGSVVLRGDATVVVRPERCDEKNDPDSAFHAGHEAVLEAVRKTGFIRLVVAYRTSLGEEHLDFTRVVAVDESEQEQEASGEDACELLDRLVPTSGQFFPSFFIRGLIEEQVMTDEESEEEGEVVWDVQAGTATLFAKPKVVQEDFLLLTGKVGRHLHNAVWLEVDGDDEN